MVAYWEYFTNSVAECQEAVKEANQTVKELELKKNGDITKQLEVKNKIIENQTEEVALLKSRIRALLGGGIDK